MNKKMQSFGRWSYTECYRQMRLMDKLTKNMVVDMYSPKHAKEINFVIEWLLYHASMPLQQAFKPWIFAAAHKSLEEYNRLDEWGFGYTASRNWPAMRFFERKSLLWSITQKKWVTKAQWYSLRGLQCPPDDLSDISF